MFEARIKTFIIALLLTFSSSQIVRAEVKVYQYDGKLPFVQMMLNMMVAMGILDRLPANGAYGASGYPSPWSSLSNPYVRALAMRGINPASSSSSLQNPYGRNSFGRNPYTNNPFARSPWLQSPWSQSGLNGISPVWGSPSWGVLPTGSYPMNDNAWDYARNGYGAPAYSPYWSNEDINGWVNEPWENSAWNPQAKPSTQVSRQQSLQTQSAQQQSPPLVQNFNFAVPDNNSVDSGRDNRSPLAKLAPPGQARSGQMRPNQIQPRLRKPNQRQPGSMRTEPSKQANSRRTGPSNKPSASRNKVRQRPCVTEFCGLKKPDLDGLWVAQNGEMLGMKNHRYLWSDGNSRYLTGQLKIQNEYLVANIDGHDTLMRFKYKLAGNRLLTMQEDGVIREFVRTAGNQYSYPNSYQNPYQNRAYQ